MATFANPYGSSYTSFSTLAPETAPAAEKVRRHPKYYLNGGDIHFLVENYIFRVHRYFFERESAVFREKLNIPPPPGANPRGSSDSNPIPLDDVREEDFSRFLWVFYNPKYSIYDANVDEWSSILKLSYDWRFAEVKRLSTRYLETFEIDPIQKIELYQLHEIDKRLLIPSYMALINRQEPLSIVEGRRLSLETALMIATARECARGKPLDSGKHSPTVASVNKESMVEIIKDVFGLKDATPSSPNLEPIYEGTGPGSFSATPMSPSKIVTSPPREGRDGVKSPTPKSKKHLPPAEELVPRHEESPTKPVTPSVPPYLTNLFSPPTPPGTIKQSSAPKEEEKEKSVDPKSTTGAAPTMTSAASTNAASKAGQSVNPRPPNSQRRPQQLPPLEISGKETKPRKTDPPPQTTNQKPQPQTPSLTRKTSLPADPPPQSPMVAQSATTLAGSALRWLRGSKEKTAGEVPSPQKDNHERKRTSSSSSRFQDHVTNTASGAGTTPSYEFNDSTTKPVLKDSSVSSAAESKVTTSAAASKATPAASTRNEPATSEPTPKADLSQTAKAKKAAAKDAKLTAKDTSTTAQNDVPSIDVQAATPAALPESEDPTHAATAPSTDTSAAAASADKPVESTAEFQAAAASASAAPVASASTPSDEPSPPAAVASTTDTKQAEPEPVVPAPPPKGAAPAADAEAAWDFGDGGSNTQKPENAAASDSPELFEDAVHVQAVSDSDDDKPLATLPGKKKPFAAEEPASKPATDTQSKPVPATNSTTGDVAVTEGAQVAAEIKNADSVAVSAEPTPAANSLKDAPVPDADAANELAKENATPAEPTTTADTSTPAGESKVDPPQSEQPTSEQPSTIVESGSGPDVKLDEPKEPAKPSDADAKPENVAKKDSDSAQAAKQEDKNSTKKPELHIDLKDGAPSAATEPTADSAVPLPTPDVEGGVQSSLPKHMQDADESGLTTEGSEQGSRPASPLAQKTTAAGGSKKKGGKKGGNKKRGG